MFGDSITTDHISPAGTIQERSPAGEYLVAEGVAPRDFNSYGARRGNHEVMVRGTFANVRIRNQLAPGTEGGYTCYLPTGEVMTDGGVLNLEAGIAPEVIRELVNRGHAVASTAAGAYGGYQAIKRENGVYAGATESRKDGQAAGY